MHLKLISLLSLSALLVRGYVSEGSYTWENVKIGGGGGFVPNIIFNTGHQGVAFAR